MSKLRLTSGASGPAFRLGSGFPAFRLNGPGAGPSMRDTYLTVEAIEATTVKFWTGDDSDSETRTVEVSTDDGQTWTSKTSSYAGTVLAELAAGEKVLLRGEEENYGSDENNDDMPYGCVVLDGGDAYLYGNIMSMAYGADFADKTAIVNDDQFCYLFGEGVAADMKFDDHQGHLRNKQGARLLLPATTLAQYCYNYMFSGCTNLVEVTIYATYLNVTDPLHNWLANVAASGTFRAVENVPYPAGASGIPNGWTRVGF